MVVICDSGETVHGLRGTFHEYGAEGAVKKYAGSNCGQMHTCMLMDIYRVTEGNGWHSLNDSLHRCRPGNLFIKNAGDAHIRIAGHASPMSIYNHMIRPVFLTFRYWAGVRFPTW